MHVHTHDTLQAHTERDGTPPPHTGTDSVRTRAVQAQKRWLTTKGVKIKVKQK